MPDLTTYLTAVVVGLVGIQLVRIAHVTVTEDRSEYRRVLDRLRWWMLPAGILHLAAVILTYLTLSRIPGLSWGWWTWLTGTPGNALVGQTDQPGLGFTIATYAIPLLILLLIPRLALAEELTFRSGSAHRPLPRRLLRAVQFGLIHCLVGIPLAAGLALTVSGLYYTWIYRRAHRQAWVLPANPLPHRALHLREHPTRAAAYTAAAAHAVTNWTVLAVVLLGLVLDLVYG